MLDILRVVQILKRRERVKQARMALHGEKGEGKGKRVRKEEETGARTQRDGGEKEESKKDVEVM